MHENYLGALISASVGLGRTPRFCMSNEFPSDAGVHFEKYWFKYLLMVLFSEAIVSVQFLVVYPIYLRVKRQSI